MYQIVIVDYCFIMLFIGLKIVIVTKLYSFLSIKVIFIFFLSELYQKIMNKM